MRDEEPDEWDYEKEYPSEFKEDCKMLLRRCLVVFNDLPDTPVKGSRGLTTYQIASAIETLLNKEDKNGV